MPKGEEMENKKTAVFGIYTTVPAADLATDRLVKEGFLASNISALMPENLGSKEKMCIRDSDGTFGNSV